jgi:hypothetical protein
VEEAASQMEKKAYRKAGETYSKAFAAFGGKGYVDDRYNAACAWSLAGNNDSAFVQLEKIATRAGFADYNNLVTDADLNKLHSDKRWKPLCALVKQNKDKAEANLDKALVAQLDTIYTADQGGRIRVHDVQEKYGFGSAEVKKVWDTINHNDSINLVKIKSIIDKYGWPGPDVAGRQGATTVFLVIQHADIATQEQYLPLMRDAVKAKKAEPSSLALLEDRVALRQGKKQIYGSQIGIDDKGGYYVDDLMDPDNVDKRRAEVGLGPLADYVQNWHLTWDAEAYKKQLPTIEERHHKQNR